MPRWPPTLVHQAVGDRLTCIFVDHGLLRKGEAEQVIETFDQHHGHASAGGRRQGGVPHRPRPTLSIPEGKRKLIGARFVRTFEAEAARLAARVGRRFGRVSGAGHALPGRDRVGQPTEHTQHARTIKTHHNVGGLPGGYDV